MPAPNILPSADVAICGGGPVGLALAALLARRGMPVQRIAVLDARPLEQAKADPRAIALSAGSARLLQEIGAWPLAASTIREIHVSRRGRFGRSLIDSADYGLLALGHVCRYGVLVEALAAACVQAGVRILRPESVASLTESDAGVTLALASGQTLAAAVAVQAEGGVFGAQAARSRQHDYRQTAIVSQVSASAAQPQRAFERFTDEGPLALLPQAATATPAVMAPGASAGMGAAMAAGPGAGPHAGPGAGSGSQKRMGDGSGNAGVLDYALVWCVRPDTATSLLALDDAAFLAALQAAFGDRVGRFTAVSARSMYPLGLNAEAAATARTVAIGNAAQTLHPVAGQGLNLGLRDATVLAGLLAADDGPSAIRQFLQARRADRAVTIRLTDVMARIFASTPADSISQGLLGLSLGLVDAIAPARRLLAEQMMYGQR